MRRNTNLDILRAVAVLLVIINHIPIADSLSFSTYFLSGLKKGGWVGVDLFFVLSGFLVSNLIFQEYLTRQSFSPRNFLIRRGFKIYPIYYLFIIFSATWTYFNHDTLNWNLVLSEIFFYINYTKYIYNGPGLLWSICVEEHFYIVLAVSLFWAIKTRRLNQRFILAVYFMTLATALVFRLVNYFNYQQFDFFRDLGKSHLRFDALFLGVVLSYSYTFKSRKVLSLFNRRWVLIIASVGVVLNFVKHPAESYLFSIVWASLNPLFFGVIMIQMLEIRRKLGWIGKSFSFVGVFSYPIYLFHSHAIGAVHRFLPDSPFNTIVSIISAVAIGILISKFVEYPILKIRDRYFPSRANMGLRQYEGDSQTMVSSLEKIPAVETNNPILERGDRLI